MGRGKTTEMEKVEREEMGTTGKGKEIGANQEKKNKINGPASAYAVVAHHDD